MLNADSSAEKSESELQRRAPAPTSRERGRVPLHRLDDVDDRLHRLLREDVLEVLDERARRVGLVEEAEDREREEDERHERHEREVGDHRREMRAALVEEPCECLPDGPHVLDERLESGAGMDASAALAELLELSTQVVEAVVVSADGDVAASRAASDERARELGERGSRPALGRGDHPFRRDPGVERVHVDLERGSLVVVRDGERSIVATTSPSRPSASSRSTCGRRCAGSARRRREARSCSPPRVSGSGSSSGGGPARRRHVVVAWDDGSELELREGSEERDRLVAIAARALR